MTTTRLIGPCLLGFVGALTLACGGGSGAHPNDVAGGGGSSSGGGSGGNQGVAGKNTNAGASGGGRGPVSMVPEGTCNKDKKVEGAPKACVPVAGCNAETVKGEYKPQGTAMVLPPGKITELKLPIDAVTKGIGATAVEFDPQNTAILFAGVEQTDGGSPQNGIYKSLDGGATWKQIGSGSDEDNSDCFPVYLDLPVHVEIDPHDGNHLYASSGVRGRNQGFWVSWDGGETFIRARDGDLTTIAVDPCDFCHVLVGSHRQDPPVGVLESFDGGVNWTVHEPTFKGWNGGSYGLTFVPEDREGKTWLLHNDNVWLTTDSGANWTSQSAIPTVHGGTEQYFASNGDIYSGADGSPIRSTDHGKTWSRIAGLSSAPYYAVIGDGTNLYAMPDGYPPPGPMLTSLETDGVTWVPYPSDPTKLQRGMVFPRFDKVAGILYFTNQKAQALKVIR